jgi:hypothetical protein
VGNEKQGLWTGGWGLEDEGLPIARACQHHPLNLSCGSRKPTNLEKEFSFWRNDAGMSMKTKGVDGMS